MNENIINELIEQNNILQDNMIELHNENISLSYKHDELNKLCSNLCQTVNELAKIITNMNRQNNNLNNRLNNLPYELLDSRSETQYNIPMIMSWDETIDEIVLNNKSITRFGDGEFGIMFGVSRWRFQKDDEKLAQRLREIVASNEPNILVGLNDFYGSLAHRTDTDAAGIRSYLTPEVRAQHMSLLKTDHLYANACISRTGTLEKIQKQKRIWEKKDCLFIEGDKTRMGVGNDLFDNATSIQRILCPSESAFDNYDTILSEALKQPKSKTVLIALGPTASVLAYDLAKAGYHAIDIGHADLSYEWFLRNNGFKTAVPHKYNNEYPEGYLVEDIYDEIYQSQILANLST